MFEVLVGLVMITLHYAFDAPVVFLDVAILKGRTCLAISDIILVDFMSQADLS
jgi:hypothetical protein